MSTSTKKAINAIPMGSLDIYMIEFAGTTIEDVPEDSAIETDDNLIGRTKDGGTLTYKPTYYTAKSDDGKASRTILTDEEVTLGFGIITRNENATMKLASTATVIEKEGGGKRTLIGGIEKDDGKIYLCRAVHKDKIAGDMRFTIIGRNLEGIIWAFKPGQENVITPTVTAEPFEDGTLLIIDEAGTQTIVKSVNSSQEAA